MKAPEVLALLTRLRATGKVDVRFAARFDGIVRPLCELRVKRRASGLWVGIKIIAGGSISSKTFSDAEADAVFAEAVENLFEAMEQGPTDDGEAIVTELRAATWIPAHGAIALSRGGDA